MDYPTVPNQIREVDSIKHCNKSSYTWINTGYPIHPEVEPVDLSAASVDTGTRITRLQAMDSDKRCLIIGPIRMTPFNTGHGCFDHSVGIHDLIRFDPGDQRHQQALEELVRR